MLARSVTLPPNDLYADGDLLRRDAVVGAFNVCCCWCSMRVTRMLPMCGAAAPDVEVLEDDLAKRTVVGRSADDERRLCTISDDVGACN